MSIWPHTQDNIHLSAAIWMLQLICFHIPWPVSYHHERRKNHHFLPTHKQTREDCTITKLQTGLLVTSSAHRMNGHNYCMMCIIHRVMVVHGSSTNSKFPTKPVSTHTSVGHLTDYTQGRTQKNWTHWGTAMDVHPSLVTCSSCFPNICFSMVLRDTGISTDIKQPASETSSFLSVCFISTPKQNRFLGLNQRDKVVWVFVGITFYFFQPVLFFPSSVAVHWQRGLDCYSVWKNV